MSTEELVKQLEGIVSSMIKALESLEKEFSDYIEVTNSRLQVLESKVQKIDARDQAISHTTTDSLEKDDVSSIESPSIEHEEPLPPTTTPIEPSINEKHQEDVTTTPIQHHPVSQPIVAEHVDATSNIQQTSEGSSNEHPTVPPVPTLPPTVPSVRSSDQQKPIVEAKDITPPTTSQASTETIKPDTKPSTEITDEDDKKELMSALELIDSL